MMAAIMGNPPAADPAKEPTTEADFFKSWMKDHYPEAPEGIAKVDNWKASRDINTKLIASLAAKETELAAAMKERASVKADGGAALPETEAVQKLSLELAAFKTKYDTELGEYQRSKAAGELQGNHAFRAEHDGRRAALFEEAKEVADEVNLDEDTLKAIFDADTEYKMAKALADVDDETAASLIRQKANEFRSLTRAKETAMKNPTAEIQKWKDHEAGFAGTTAKNFTEAMRQRMASEAEVAAKELSESNIFFKMESGQAVLADIRARIDQGQIPSPAEQVRHMALAASAPIFQQLATQQAQKIAQLQQALSRYVKADPSQTGASPTQGGGSGGFDVASLFGRR